MTDKRINERINETIRYYGAYTILFALGIWGLLLWFWHNGSSLVWLNDGIEQHYNALAYYGEYLREVLKTIFVEHSLNVPLFDFSIGYGSDIIETLQFYVAGNPLNLIAAAVPKEYMEILYEGLFILRLYLAGISFSVFARYHKNENSPVLLGALVYVFSEYGMNYFSVHPFFLNPMIYLPLLLLGVDKVFKEKKAVCYILMIALSAISSFYFFYMLGIFTVLYAVFRYFHYYGKIQGKALGGLLFRFCGYSLIGVLMAGCTLVPAVHLLFQTGRFQTKNYIPFLYGLKYYGKMLVDFISVDSPGYNCMMGFSAAGFLCVVLLFLRKRRRDLKVGFVLLTLFLCLPFAGHVLNGFSYVTNRWCFAYAMLVSYILVVITPEIRSASVKEKRIMLAGGCFLGMACAAFAAARYFMERGWEWKHTLFHAGMLGLTTVLVLLVPWKKRKSSRAVYLILSLLVLAGAAENHWVLRESYHKYMKKGTAQESLETPPSVRLKDYGDSQLWRYEQSGTGERKNTGLQTGMNGLSFYFSMVSPYITQFQRLLYFKEPLDFSFSGLDQRSSLDTLFGVKYYVTLEKNKFVPMGFEKIETFSQGGRKYAVYAADTKIPFVLGYEKEKVLSVQDFEKLSIEERQGVILEYAVLDQPDTLWESQWAQKTIGPEPANFRLQSYQGVEVKGQEILVSEKDAKAVFSYEIQEKGELQLIFENLRIEGLKERNTWTAVDADLAPRKITIEGENGRRTLVIQNPQVAGGYCDRHDFVCSLGTAEPHKGSITITFPVPGRYHFDQMRLHVVSQRLSLQQKKALETGIHGSFSQTVNGIEGTLRLDDDKRVMFSVPYSPGWTLWADGEKKPLDRTNLMFLSCELEKGTHQLELRYENPYVKLGALLSGLGLLLLFLYLAGNRSRERKRKK